MDKPDGKSHRKVLENVIRRNKFSKIAEIGVKRGDTFLYLLDKFPHLHATGVDIWENEVEKLPRHEARIRAVCEVNYPKRSKLIKMRSTEAADLVEDKSLDAVFIDADHSEMAIRADIEKWRPKLRDGGLLCGHDVHMESVKTAVDDLLPGWAYYGQSIWGIYISKSPSPLILTAIPYDDERNLGKAYNQVMELLPEDGWAVLLDHDAMFTTPEWHRQISSVIAQRPEGCFTVKTNRIKCPYQQTAIDGVMVDIKNHDYLYHRQIGAKLLDNKNLTDVTDDREPSGLVFVMSKQAWRDAGGFAEGLHYVDRTMWLALKLSGRRIYLIEGLYVYHYHRGGGEAIQAGEWVERHKMPGGRVIFYKDTHKRPKYG
jgi:hypothetical protein